MKHLLTILILCGYIAISQTPQTLNYQGYLSDSNGDPVNGTENITFRIYDVDTGGSALWTEARTVTLNDGVFSVVLGENTPIDLPFDTQYWLGITVGGSELSPRTKLASSAYASNLPKVAFVKDVKASGTPAGTFTAGAWRTRDLNDLTGNTEFISLNSNQFTLDAGTYIVRAIVPAYRVSNHQSRLRNITDGSTTLLGISAYADNTEAVGNVSNIIGEFTIASQKTFEIQHYCSVTFATDGFGARGITVENEVYTVVEITKIAN